MPMNDPQRRRPPRERVDGVLLLDKPRGLSSNDALVRAKRLLNAEKAGHGGTLDPMATGLLPLAFGEATKFAHDLLEADKAYLAELTLGVTTDTGDAEGEVTSRAEVAADEAAFRAAAAAFVGEIEQVPPMHSALKHQGRPLYEYARAGETIERAPRRVTIRAIDVLDFEPPRATIRVACSKGTYVRTLAEDIGRRLGCGAHLSALRRERVGALSLADAVTLDALEALDPAARRAALRPVDFLLAGLERVALGEPEAERFLHGQRLRIAPAAAGRPGADRSPPDACAEARPSRHDAPRRVAVYRAGRLLGVARLDDGLLAPERLVAAPVQNSTEQP